MIYGEKVVLCAVERKHLPNYVTWLNDPEVRYFLLATEPVSIAGEEQWYEQQLKRSDRLVYAIEYQGQHVGGCGIHDIDHRNRSAEVGIMVGVKELWNKGLGTDAMRTIVRHGFETVNLHRIFLRVYEDNARGIRSYEKVGFRHEGRSREAVYRNGKYLDEIRMSILEQEWRAMQPQQPVTGQAAAQAAAPAAP